MESDLQNKTTYDMACVAFEEFSPHGNESDIWVHFYFKPGNLKPVSFENILDQSGKKINHINLTDEIPLVINRTGSNVQYFNNSMSYDLKFLEIKKK